MSRWQFQRAKSLEESWEGLWRAWGARTWRLAVVGMLAIRRGGKGATGISRQKKKKKNFVAAAVGGGGGVL